MMQAYRVCDRIVELAEGVAEFKTAGEEFEAFHVSGIVRLGLGQWGNLDRVVVDDCRLDEEWFDDRLKQVVDQLADWRAFQRVVIDGSDRSKDGLQFCD